ncbi:AbrB/MazE/SpoVT family DNA-binding domain-containing protein [Moorella sulfitireducens]
MEVKVSSKYQIVIPKDVRELFNIKNSPFLPNYT